MPKLEKIFTLEITPEQFLNNCSQDELKEIDLLIQSNFYQKRINAAKCKICGCTDFHCNQCIEKTGEPCYWLEPDLCSACQDSNKQGIDYGK